MKFKFEADAEIEAESFDDAFGRLSDHFAAFARGERKSSMIWVGKIGLRGAPITESKPARCELCTLGFDRKRQPDGTVAHVLVQACTSPLPLELTEESPK